MTLEMHPLETARLIIRKFMMDDLEDVYRLVDIELNAGDLRFDKDDHVDYRKHRFF